MSNKQRNRGFTLVELMISMVLGLVVVGGTISMVLANKRSYRTTEGLSQVQESSRTAYELLARDIREAGSVGCDGVSNRVANVVNGAPGVALLNFASGLKGYDNSASGDAIHGEIPVGTAVGQRVAGTDVLLMQSVTGSGLTVENTPSNTAANFKVNQANDELQNGDIVVVCDFDHATIVQITKGNSDNKTVVHDTGNNASPGNCSNGLGYPTPSPCSNAAGQSNGYIFDSGSVISRYQANAWYIGNNGRPETGGRSLFRRRLLPGYGFANEEMVAGVTDMQMRFRRAATSALVSAASISDPQWTEVNTVEVVLTLDSADRNISTDPATNSGRLQRPYSFMVAVRNRLP